MYSQMRFKTKFDLYRSRYAEHHVKKLLAIIIIIIVVRSVELYEHITYIFYNRTVWRPPEPWLGCHYEQNI